MEKERFYELMKLCIPFDDLKGGTLIYDQDQLIDNCIRTIEEDKNLLKNMDENPDNYSENFINTLKNALPGIDKEISDSIRYIKENNIKELRFEFENKNNKSC
ncbi:MAG TPA: hypothetical protein PLC25_05030 [Bacilli bacterium]|nr:hypothetical protein [Bacilli bacterium]